MDTSLLKNRDLQRLERLKISSRIRFLQRLSIWSPMLHHLCTRIELNRKLIVWLKRWIIRTLLYHQFWPREKTQMQRWLSRLVSGLALQTTSSLVDYQLLSYPLFGSNLLHRQSSKQHRTWAPTKNHLPTKTRSSSLITLALLRKFDFADDLIHITK